MIKNGPHISTFCGTPLTIQYIMTKYRTYTHKGPETKCIQLFIKIPQAKTFIIRRATFKMKKSQNLKINYKQCTFLSMLCKHAFCIYLCHKLNCNICRIPITTGYKKMCA